MKKLFIAAIIVLLLSAFAALAYIRAQDELNSGIEDLRGRARVDVVLTDKGFEPSAIRVSDGTVVTFSTTRGAQFWPASDPHPSHTDYPEFDPKEPIAASSTWSFVFDRPGRWGYHDHIRSYFSGTIYVEPLQ